jgi:hypothetical protein
MLETIIYIVIFWIIARTLIELVGFVQSIDPVEQEQDIKDHLRQRNISIVTVRVEQINGWWYGFYHTKAKGEVFIAQGTTFDEAVQNCHDRLQDDKFNLKLEFEKK